MTEQRRDNALALAILYAALVTIAFLATSAWQHGTIRELRDKATQDEWVIRAYRETYLEMSKAIPFDPGDVIPR